MRRNCARPAPGLSSSKASRSRYTCSSAGFLSSAARSGVASNSSKQSSTEPSAPDKRSFTRPGLALSSTSANSGISRATCAASVPKARRGSFRFASSCLQKNLPMIRGMPVSFSSLGSPLAARFPLRTSCAAMMLFPSPPVPWIQNARLRASLVAARLRFAAHSRTSRKTYSRVPGSY